MWKPLSAYALDPESASHPKFAEWTTAADAAASRLRFFHWELEFPEVYFGTDGKSLGGQAGFDAVVGNPPYVQQEELGPYKPFFAAGYPQVSHGVADLSVYFLGQGVRQLRRDGVISFITSGTFRKLNFGGPLRQYLAEQTTLVEMVDFGEQQVFTDATTYPVILQIRKAPPQPGGTFTLTQPVPKTEHFQQVGQVKPPLGSSAWVFTTEALRHIVEGWKGSTPLGKALTGPPYRGVTTGLNEAFVVNQQTRDRLVAGSPETASLLKAFIRGEDLHPWYQVHDGLWLITLPNDWTQSQFQAITSDTDAWNELEAQYPALAEHLSHYQTQARIRQDQGRYWWELRPCNYYSAFEQPRIHSTKVTLFPKFSLSDEVSYAGNTSYVLPVPDMKTGYYLLGLLNSHICEYFCRSVFAAKANGYYEVQPEPLSRFPIPNASDEDKAAVGMLAREITAEAKARYAQQEKVRQRLVTDFGSPGISLNQKLTAWWTLDFPGLRRELVKVFKHDIPVKERDEWQEWFEAQTKAHTERTGAIVVRETALNARVYTLFQLKEAERALIEAATKYRYGEV